MLDEFGAEIEHADSRMDATMRKVAKVLHLSDGNIIMSFILKFLSWCVRSTAMDGDRSSLKRDARRAFSHLRCLVSGKQ